MSQYINNVIQVLERLAAPAEDQLAYLTSLGVTPSVDELALELSDLVIPTACPAELTEEQFRAVIRVSTTIEKMSGAANKHLWDIGSLGKASEWADIRILAKEALASLHTSDTPE